MSRFLLECLVLIDSFVLTAHSPAFLTFGSHCDLQPPWTGLCFLPPLSCFSIFCPALLIPAPAFAARGPRTAPEKPASRSVALSDSNFKYEGLSGIFKWEFHLGTTQSVFVTKQSMVPKSHPWESVYLPRMINVAIFSYSFFLMWKKTCTPKINIWNTFLSFNE